MNTITRGQFRALQSELGESVVREKYSGRGMCGEHCVGFCLDNATELADLTLMLQGVLGPEQGAELARSFSQDAMGHGVIFYAKSWSVEEPVLKTFLVETREYRDVTYTVPAEDEEDARTRIANGEGEELSAEFDGFTATQHDWNVTELVEDDKPQIVPPLKKGKRK